MNAKEQEAKSQIASNNLLEKQGLLFPITLELGGVIQQRGNNGDTCTRKKSSGLAHKYRLPWRGSSLEDVLFPHCAQGAEGS